MIGLLEMLLVFFFVFVRICSDLCSDTILLHCIEIKYIYICMHTCAMCNYIQRDEHFAGCELISCRF